MKKALFSCTVWALILCMVISVLDCQALAESTSSITDQLQTELTEELQEGLSDEDAEVQVAAYYVSEEYLEDIAFLNRETDWFGYYLPEIDSVMEGKKWVFTCQDGQTIYREFEPYDDTMNKVLLGAAIAGGAAIIIVTIVITLASGGTAVAALGLPAPTLSKVAISAITEGLSAGIIEVIKTGGDATMAVNSAAAATGVDLVFGVITR